MTEIDEIFSSHRSCSSQVILVGFCYVNKIMLAISHFYDQIFLTFISLQANRLTNVFRMLRFKKSK